MDIVERIKEKIERVKVIKYNEEIINTNGSFMKVIRGEYHLNNKQVIVREKIRKNIGVGNAVCVFAITRDNKILLVIQPRASLPTNDKVNIEIPAGYIDENEDCIRAGIRELREETGYDSDNLVYLDSYFPSLGGSSEKIDLVLAMDCEKVGMQNLDDDEFVEYIEVDFFEFEYLLENGYLLDANCRIAYYRVLDYLEEKYFGDIVSSLIDKNKTISTMESCIGGYFANGITNICNSSKVLKYSAVTYSNDYKIKMGVSSKVIDKYSVYSLECARDMAYHISDFSCSNYGIGVTGTLKKFDDNNKSCDDDLVYICIYDRDNDKYYDYKYRVYSNKRVYNKRLVSYYIASKLLEIIRR